MTSSQQGQIAGGVAAKTAVPWAKPARSAGGARPKSSGASAELTVQVVILAALFFVRFYHVFHSLWFKWQDPNWGHGYLVPLFSLWFLYIRRHKLKRVKLQRTWVGIAILILGMALEFISVYLWKVNYGRYLGMVISVFGLVLFLGGWGLMRHAWVSVVFLIFMLPVPYQYYERVASPLQDLAAKASVTTLNIFQVKAVTEGTVIQIPMGEFDAAGNEQYAPLSVVEACAGLRLLMAFIALGVAFAYLSDKPIWQRIVLIVMTVPIAVFCNMIRVSGTGLLYRFASRENDFNKTVSTGFMHDFAGWVMLLVAMAILFGVGALTAWLSRVFKRNDEEALPQSGLFGSAVSQYFRDRREEAVGEKAAASPKTAVPAELALRLSRIPLVMAGITLTAALGIAAAVVALRLSGTALALGGIAAVFAGIYAVAVYEKARAIVKDAAAGSSEVLLKLAFVASVATVLVSVATLAVMLVRSG